MKGCMKIMTVLFGLVIVACIGFVALYAFGSDLVQDEALEANAGRGTLDNPIPAGEVVTFTEHFSVEVLEVIRPATARVEQMNMFNEDPAAGTDYVLIKFRMSCLQSGSSVCNGFDLKVRIVDSAGNEWGEPTIIMLDPSLDSRESIGGGTMEGYKGFEFPVNGTMQSLKMWTVGGATLYAELDA